MDNDPKKLAFIEVPFRCPLPAFCPVCSAPAEKTLRARAWEGIPLIFTYHLSISIPYCRRHYEELAGLEFRQRVFIWGTFVIPVASLLPAGYDWGLRWLFWLGCFFSLACLFLAFYYSKCLSESRGVRMRTQGSWPGYLLSSNQPDWNLRLNGLVDKYKKEHEKRT
jgi:hypothetical protein